MWRVASCGLGFVSSTTDLKNKDVKRLQACFFGFVSTLIHFGFAAAFTNDAKVTHLLTSTIDPTATFQPGFIKNLLL